MAPQQEPIVNPIDKQLFASLIDQVEATVTASGGLANISRWIEANTAHPTLSNKPWTFQGHEWQSGILNDTSPEVVVRKSTQIGASEAILRLALALLAKLPNTKALYVLPSQKFAGKFATSRISPVIAASQRLSTLLDRQIDSTEIKKIGSSFLFLAGAASVTQSISIPARVLIIDELAFCNPAVLSVFSSRLGHQRVEDRVVRKFSSPLFPGSDISELHDQGTQNVYMCYHDSCGQWVVVEELEDLVLPGYDGHLSDLSYSELRQLESKLPKAYVKCSHCGNRISQANLCDPARRSWVPKFPAREVSSYHAGPLVLPSIRTPELILKDLFLYKNTVRWQQYSLGVPAESASDMILQGAMDRAFTVSPDMASAASYGVMGVDVGKMSHITIGKQVDHIFNVLKLDTVVQDEQDATGRKILDLHKYYVCQKIVIDAMPDISLPKSIQGKTPVGMTYGCYFVTGKGKGNLELYEIKEADGVVMAARTRSLDEFVSEFNKGHIRLPMGMKNEDEVKSHLSKMKRLLDYDAAGEEKAQWVTTDSANHWFFSIYYAWLASKMMQSAYEGAIPIGMGSFVSKVRMKSAA